ncbi:hypothetical protein ACLMJK_006566 [Lecanora helva]
MADQVPTAQQEMADQPPAVQQEMAEQLPAAQQEMADQPPTAQQEMADQVPAAQQEMAEQLPTAQEFLDSLVEDHSGKETSCNICLRDFGTSYGDDVPAEHATALPCGHIVGSWCINMWMSSTEAGQSTCPYCRRVLCQIRVVPRRRRRQPRRNQNIMSIAAVLNTPRNQVLDAGIDPIVRRRTHMRQWLRRRLQAYAPITEAEIHDWVLNHRAPVMEFNATNRPTNPDRARWTLHREIMLYCRLRSDGADLPRLPCAEDGSGQRYMTRVHEDAFLQELCRRGAFTCRPGSSFAGWQRGNSPREIWKILREEGYVYGNCFERGRAQGYHGWVGMFHDNHYPSLVESHEFLINGQEPEGNRESGADATAVTPA